MNDFNYPPILYKYLDYDGGKAMLDKETLLFSPVSSLNDPHDCHHIAPVEANYETFSVEFDCNVLFKGVGICSLTDDPLNILMWTHYAKGHRGFCVGINMREVMPILGYHQNVDRGVFFKKVTYQDRLPSINMFDIVSKDLDATVEDNFVQAQRAINTFLSTKTKLWENENEYRLILRGKITTKPQRAFAKIENGICCVYLGCRFPQNKRAEIFKIARERDLKVFQMLLSLDGKRMDAIEINE